MRDEDRVATLARATTRVAVEGDVPRSDGASLDADLSMLRRQDSGD